MGKGYSYVCSKCGKNFDVFLGIGMMFPVIYRRTIEEIKSGKYGEEWKKIFNSQPYTATNAHKYLYKCKNCGYWEESKELSLYVPNDLESFPKTQFGIKTVEEWGYVPYVTEIELKYDYHLIKRYIHKCPKCGKTMNQATEKNEFLTLSCPDCGALAKREGELMWD